VTDRKNDGFVRVGESGFFKAIAQELEAQAPPQPKPLSAKESKLLETAVAVRQEPPDPEELAFMARELVQCTLPHSDPGQVPFWKRQNGNFTLALSSTFDPKTGALVGYPYGSIPRLLLFWLTSEALRTGDRKIQLGSTYNQFIRAVGLSTDTGRGKRGDAKRLQDQTKRLFTTNISFIYAEQRPTGPSPEARLNMNVASRSLIWWDPRKPDQMSFFDNWIELSGEFFQAITAAPVPLDTRALKALKRSPLALDLYAWSTHKALTVARRGRRQFVPWRGLMAQFGADYSDVQNFRRKAEDALKKIQAVFPGLKLQDATGGVVVLPTSRPAIDHKPSKRRQLPPAK
jgi:hypothetical protein